MVDVVAGGVAVSGCWDGDRVGAGGGRQQRNNTLGFQNSIALTDIKAILHNRKLHSSAVTGKLISRRDATLPACSQPVSRQVRRGPSLHDSGNINYKSYLSVTRQDLLGRDELNIWGCNVIVINRFRWC